MKWPYAAAFVVPMSTISAERLLGTLVAEHSSALIVYVRAIVGDHHLAEDIVQETLVRAWRRADRLQSSAGSLHGWLTTVARNLAIDHLRSAAARRETVSAIDEPVTSVPDHADRVVARAEAAAMMRLLTPEHQVVVANLYLGGRTAAETARRIGIPVGTVKSRQHYALVTMRAAVMPVPPR